MEHSTNLIDILTFPLVEDSLPGAQPLVSITLVAVAPTSINGEVFNADGFVKRVHVTKLETLRLR